MPPGNVGAIPTPVIRSGYSREPHFRRVLESSTVTLCTSIGRPAATLNVGLNFSKTVFVYFSTPFRFGGSQLGSAVILPFRIVLDLNSTLASTAFATFGFSSTTDFGGTSEFSFSVAATVLSYSSLVTDSMPSEPSCFLNATLESVGEPSTDSPVTARAPPTPGSLRHLVVFITMKLQGEHYGFLSSNTLPF